MPLPLPETTPAPGLLDLMQALHLSNPLVKVLLPLAAITAVVLLCRFRRTALGADLRLVPPPPGQLLGWVVLSVLWMLGTDALLHWRGPWNFGPWRAQAPWVSGARVLAVGVLGPVAEELVVRGLIYFRLRRAGLNEWLVIGLTAAGWAGMHVDYSPAVMAIIFVEGLLLGLARRSSGSLWVPILMHISWNLYAVW
jgi:membrane protease YdiL (CAAX protease family)